jgi:hypothetical protein
MLLVRTALRGVLAVHKRKDILAVIIVMRQRHFYVFALSGE